MPLYKGYLVHHQVILGCDRLCNGGLFLLLQHIGCSDMGEVLFHRSFSSFQNYIYLGFKIFNTDGKARCWKHKVSFNFCVYQLLTFQFIFCSPSVVGPILIPLSDWVSRNLLKKMQTCFDIIIGKQRRTWRWVLFTGLALPILLGYRLGLIFYFFFLMSQLLFPRIMRLTNGNTPLWQRT